jgi:hypothetical protein
MYGALEAGKLIGVQPSGDSEADIPQSGYWNDSHPFRVEAYATKSQRDGY